MRPKLPTQKGCNKPMHPRRCTPVALSRWLNKARTSDRWANSIYRQEIGPFFWKQYETLPPFNRCTPRTTTNSRSSNHAYHTC